MEKAQLVIGIMGGIGSGKSQVAAVLHELGAEVINADILVHQILKLPEVKREITQLWGEHLVVAGEIDKKALAAIVFSQNPSSTDALHRLESIIHPRVRERIEKRLKDSDREAVVIDAPLLWEGGLYRRCDVLIFVDTPLKIRQQRVASSRGWSPRDLITREQHQGDLAAKRKIAHYIVFNGGDLKETRKQVLGIWQALFEKPGN